MVVDGREGRLLYFNLFCYGERVFKQVGRADLHRVESVLFVGFLRFLYDVAVWFCCSFFGICAAAWFAE